MNSAEMFSTEDDDRYDRDEDDRHNSCCCLLRDKCLFNKNENSIFDNLNWCSNLSQNGCRYKLWGPCLEEGVIFQEGLEYAGFVMNKILKPLLVVPRLASLKLVI